MTHNEIQLDETLNRATNGLRLAGEVLSKLEVSQRVTLDFERVHRVTPSFANAFVMTLLDRLTLDELRARIVMLNRKTNVAQAISESARRYMAGIRLTTQKAVA